jgi:bifunctional non-homologous end joining protein LigD
MGAAASRAQEAAQGPPATPQADRVQQAPQGQRHKILCREADLRHLEGIMAKRADSPYASGRRTADWLKVKTAQRQEVVIAGFTAPRRTRPFFGALVLAVRDDDAWRYIGHVGTGFSHQVLEELHNKLVRLKTAKSPFPGQSKG